MSTIECCLTSLHALNSTIDSLLNRVFGDDAPSIDDTKTVGQATADFHIVPAEIDVLPQLHAFGLEPMQMEALATEFTRCLSSLTKHWANLPSPAFHADRPSEFNGAYATTVQELYQSQAEELTRKFLEDVKVVRDADRVDHDVCSQANPSALYGTPGTDDDETSEGENESQDGDDVDPEDSSSELERYYVILERLFLSGVRHPSRELKAVMSAEWGVSPRSLAVWFQNRRDRMDDDIITEIDFTTRLNLGVEDEDDWSDEGEVPWNALEDFEDDNEVPDLPHLESGADPYRVPSLSHSVATASDTSSSRFPSPVYTVGTSSPRSKSENLPPTRPTTPDAAPRTSSLSSISTSSSFSFSIPGLQSRDPLSFSSRGQPLFRMEPSEDVHIPVMNIDQKWLLGASEHTPPSRHVTPIPERCRNSRGEVSSLTSLTSPSFLPFSSSSTLPPVLQTHPMDSSPSGDIGPSQTSTFSFTMASTRSITPALTTSPATSAAPSPAAGPATPEASSFSFGASMGLRSTHSPPDEPTIREVSPTATPKIPTFEFNFGPPLPIQSYDAYQGTHLTFGPSNFEPVRTPAQSMLATPATFGEQPSKQAGSVQTEKLRASEEPTCPESVALTRDEGVLSPTENDEQEAGRIIFFPSADDAFGNESKALTDLEHPRLNRPLTSFEDAVQLHFLATAAALVDERQPAKARQDAKDAIDATTISAPSSPFAGASSGYDRSDDEAPLMGALLPISLHAKIEEKEMEQVHPEAVPLPQSPLSAPSTPMTPVMRPVGPAMWSPSSLLAPTTDDPLPLPTLSAPSAVIPSESFVNDVSSSPSPSEALSTSRSPSPAPVTPSVETPLTASIITFPSASYSLDFKPVTSQAIPLDIPFLDLFWSSSSHISTSKACEPSPFEEFMPPFINFQPPHPEPNPELENFLETFLIDWSNGGPKPIA